MLLLTFKKSLSFTSRSLSSLSLLSSSLSSSSLSSSSSSSSYQSIMNIPIKLRGFNDVINMYDIFLLDQFGVLHNGKQAIPGNLHHHHHHHHM